MGSHVWLEQCPYCGFEEMYVSSYNNCYSEVVCQICGYAKWTEERVPSNHDVEIAKHALSEMGAKEKQKAVELYHEDSIPLIVKLKGKFQNEG